MKLSGVPMSIEGPQRNEELRRVAEPCRCPERMLLGFGEERARKLKSGSAGSFADHHTNGAHAQHSTPPATGQGPGTVPLSVSVTSTHVSGYRLALVVTASCAATAQYLEYLCSSLGGLPTVGCVVAFRSPHKGRTGGQPRKCLGAQAMRRRQGKGAPCFRLDLTGAGGPHMSALPAASRSWAIATQCLA